MAVILAKGGNVNLSKEDPSLNKIFIGLGWDIRVTTGASYDLDASAFMLGANGKVRTEKDFIFYNELKSQCGSVVHQGDNRTGDGDGDDEVIKVELKKIPSSIEKIAFTVTIHDAIEKRQNFGQVAKAYIRICDETSVVKNQLTGEDDFKEIARYDLSEDASTVTSMIFGELYRYNGDWKFKAVGQGFNQGLSALCGNYGVDVA